MPAQSKEHAMPWKMMSFQERPASKKDYWTVLSDWVIRSHGSTRTHPFHPLHASFPLHEEGGEALNPRRVTVAFFEGHDTPSIFEDSWMTSPSPETRTIWKSRGKWTGFTFFSRKIVEEHGTQAGSGSVVDQHPVPVEEETSEATRRGYAHGGVTARGKAACCLKPPQHDEQDVCGFELVEDGA